MGTTTDGLLHDIDVTLAELRRDVFLRYEREINPQSAWILSDYAASLASDTKPTSQAASHDDLVQILVDLKQMRFDTKKALLNRIG
jgi:hypothetical protein